MPDAGPTAQSSLLLYFLNRHRNTCLLLFWSEAESKRLDQPAKQRWNSMMQVVIFAKRQASVAEAAKHAAVTEDSAVGEADNVN